MTAGELYLTIRREKVAITRKYQPLFLWSVLTFQLAFVHSLGRTSRHTSNCFAHDAPDIYNSPPLPYPSTTTIISHLLLHALYRKIPIPTTPKAQRKNMLSYHHAAPSYSARPPSPRQQQIRQQQVGASMANWEQAAAMPNDYNDDDEAPPPPYSRTDSLHRTNSAEEEEEEDREEAERPEVRLQPTPNGHHLLAMTVNSSITGNLHFQPTRFPCTGTFLAFQKYWKAVWFKACQQKFLRPGALEIFVWEMRILFFEADAERRGRFGSTTPTTMVLGEDTWPIFQQYMAQGSGDGVAGMRLQVDIDASRRARRVCRETAAADGNHNEAMLLLLGRHVPTTTPAPSTTPAQAGSKRQQLKQLFLGCRKDVQRLNAEAKAAAEARHAETRRRELVMVARSRELHASRLAVSG